MWYPLESNPDVLNKYMDTIGVKSPRMEFVDVYGVDPDLLSMVPSPVGAVLFVFPISEMTSAQSDALIEKQTEEREAFVKENTFFYTKQLIGNACGTIAVLHALINNYGAVGLVESGSILDRIATGSKGKTADEVGNEVAANRELEAAHSTAAEEGHTENQPIDADIDLHFVCYIHVGGRCIELDGRQKGPILHDVCVTNNDFLLAAARAIKEKMDTDPTSFEYSITALCGCAHDDEETA